jgi:D-alanyl-D-alanine carboxypeptidase
MSESDIWANVTPGGRSSGRANGKANRKTNGTYCERDNGRGRCSGDRRRIRRVIRKSFFLITALSVACVLYLASGRTVLSISKINPGVGSLKGNIENIAVSKAGLSGITFRRADISEIDLSNELVLVNSEHKLDDNFAADLSPAYRIVPLSTSDMEMNGTVLAAVDEMFEEAKENGYKDFFVNSGFRSFERQKEIYEKADDKSFVQEPGASEHQTGYALDIAYNGLTGEAFDRSPQGKWLMENAHKYGSILRYPKDKTDITEISYEAWHYRYVGIPHSYYCYKNNLCLEEYISFLANGGSYTISIDKVNYTVYYATENNGFIDVPADKDCRVSSDNTGGYVVTVMG